MCDGVEIDASCQGCSYTGGIHCECHGCRTHRGGGRGGPPTAEAAGGLSCFPCPRSLSCPLTRRARPDDFRSSSTGLARLGPATLNIDWLLLLGHLRWYPAKCAVAVQ